MRKFSVKSEATVTDQLIADIVITAFEGGSVYWCEGAQAVERDENGDWYEMIGEQYTQYQIDGVGAYANPEFWENDKRGYRLTTDEGEEIKKVLTLASLLKALRWQQPKPTPAEKRLGSSSNWFRKLVDRVVAEDYDAGDADTLVQVAVFNEVVYG